jgi:phosphatidate cytidylyltransferase
MPSKNFLVRLLTGAAFATVVTAATCLHPVAFGILYAAVVGIATWEFLRMGKVKGGQLVAGVAAAVYLFAATALVVSNLAERIVFVPYILFLIGILVSGLYEKKSNVNRWSMSLFAQFYCAGLITTLNLIAFDSNGNYSPDYVLMILAFIWINDSAAYLVGSNWGKRKLFPSISPLKSWEGFWGGLVVTLATAITLANVQMPITLEWFHWAALALLIVISGTFGDLVESKMKRFFGKKDSGTLLPGHGGILDRFDSVILAAPVVYCYIEVFIRK